MDVDGVLEGLYVLYVGAPRFRHTYDRIECVLHIVITLKLNITTCMLLSHPCYPTHLALPLRQLGASVRLFVSINNPDEAEALDYIFMIFPTYS